MPHNNTPRPQIKEVLRRPLETAGMSECVGNVVPTNIDFRYTFSLHEGQALEGSPRRSPISALIPQGSGSGSGLGSHRRSRSFSKPPSSCDRFSGPRPASSSPPCGVAVPRRWRDRQRRPAHMDAARQSGAGPRCRGPSPSHHQRTPRDQVERDGGTHQRCTGPQSPSRRLDHSPAEEYGANGCTYSPRPCLAWAGPERGHDSRHRHWPRRGQAAAQTQSKVERNATGQV
jgi:hypothetical protein